MYSTPPVRRRSGTQSKSSDSGSSLLVTFYVRLGIPWAYYNPPPTYRGLLLEGDGVGPIFGSLSVTLRLLFSMVASALQFDYRQLEILPQIEPLL